MGVKMRISRPCLSLALLASLTSTLPVPMDTIYHWNEELVYAIPFLETAAIAHIAKYKVWAKV